MPVRLLLTSLFLLLSFGCGGRAQLRQEGVEAELRTKERENRELKESLEAYQNQTKALENEFLARQAAQSKNSAEDRSIGIAIKDLILGTGTAGLDEDGLPGDEGFQVVVVPRDEDGSPLKVPGVLKVFASQFTSTGTKESLGGWQVDGATLRKTWKTGLFSTGYYVPVYWQTLPKTSRIRIQVQLLTLDGRTFEAEKDISIKLPSP
ncbi:hypothetical protein KIH39_05870 [Telmatocola sphagniphila]|uniref:Lipoprotein n=1 Tax=Telmatocola sphagniphila TaxID=1123043 RepID=A0A8E6EU98_9BACT|nr:hypothetical protein [Telmatocola sphagniphila]QVL33439.1 hypothetical protein KIH39_05870 [Telmatocola sphagniphila]